MKLPFVMAEGIDGSGKGTVIEALKEWAFSKRLKVFDLRSYWKDNDGIPEFDEVKDYDVIISSQPTYSLVGRGLREEMIKDNKRTYSAVSIAHAFSLDREILCRKLIIPALKSKKIVFQERGIVSSLVYQPVEGVQLQETMNLPGNKLSLQYLQGIIFIVTVSPEAATERLALRTKKDESIYENLFFLKKLDERYKAEWLKQLLENQGSDVVYIDNNPPKTEQELKDEVIKAWEDKYEAIK
jgi:thymidylate kinase